MFYMVCYDIVDASRRRKIQKKLEGYGERVQYSVFECDLSESQHNALLKEITKSINKDKDSVRFYSLCNACFGKVEYIGTGEVKEDDSFFIV